MAMGKKRIAKSFQSSDFGGGMKIFSCNCTSHKLNPHDHLDKLCICGIYEWTMNFPTTETSQWGQVHIMVGPAQSLSCPHLVHSKSRSLPREY